MARERKAGKSKRKTVTQRRKTRRRGKSPLLKEAKDVGLQVQIERTHQDEISWGAYIQLEPAFDGDEKETQVPYQNVYLVEVSWPGAKLKTPYLVDPVVSGGMKTLQFLMAGPGYPGSKVLIRLRFSPGLSFSEIVTVRAWNLATGVEQVPAFHTVSFEPGKAPFP